MRTAGRRDNRRGPCAARLIACAAFVGATALLISRAGFATPLLDAHLGASFEVLSRGPTTSIEITLKPTTEFGKITVEAASGVATFSPPCSFSAVAAGAAYSCVVEVIGTSGDAAFTINIVGERPGAAGAPLVVEVSHFTLQNPSFVRPNKAPAGNRKPNLISRGPDSP